MARVLHVKNGIPVPADREKDQEDRDDPRREPERD